LGNIYLAGSTLSFGAGSLDALVLKFSSSGDLLWQRTWGRHRNDEAFGICVADDGSLYVAGRTQVLDQGGNFDCFTLKYDADGNLLWQRLWGTLESDWTWGIAADNNSHAVVTGHTSGFNPDNDDVFVIKYNSDGSLLWQRIWDGGQDDCGYGVECDDAGNPYIGGSIDELGVQQVLLLKFSPSGALLGSDVWEHTIYSHTYLGDVLAIDSEQAVRLVGSTEYVTGGSWITVSGTASGPTGTTNAPNGTSMVPTGIIHAAKGPLTEPVGVLDTGSGFNDTLVLKHTMQ